MNSPVEDAYVELAARCGAALASAGFLSDAGLLEIDPEGDWEPDGDLTGVQTGAGLVKLETRSVREIFGGARRHFVVERTARLGLGVAGVVPDGDPSHEARMLALVGLIAAIPSDDPTLGGLCERLDLTAAEDDDLPPDGIRKMISFTLRVRSGDPLGLTAL